MASLHDEASRISPVPFEGTTLWKGRSLWNRLSLQDAGGPSVGGLGAAQGALACSNLDEEEAALRSHMRRERGRRRKQRKSAFSGFDLSLVNEQIMDFLVDGSSNSLELPDFSKMQRMQVSLTELALGVFLHVQKNSLCKRCPPVPRPRVAKCGCR